MNSTNLNPVQVIMLVGRLLSEQQFDVLANLAREDQRVFNQLVKTMQSGEAPLYFFAATSLSKVGAPALEPLLKALQHPNYPTRQIAAMGLGDMGDTRAIEGVTTALRDPHEHVRQAAAIALGKIGSAESVEPLLQAIGDDSELVRKAVVNALGMIGNDVAIPTLKWLIAEDTLDVAEKARKAIQRIQKRKP